MTSKTRLGDLIQIKHGFAFAGEYFCTDVTENILVTPGNFKIGGGFKKDKFKYYKGPIDSEYVLQKDDLIVTMTDLSKEGDTLGFPAFVPQDRSIRYLHNQRIGKVLFKNDNIDKKYLYYLLCTREYRHEVLATATGSTVKHTAPSRIENFEFFLPPLERQQKIAHSLSAIDDKIEINNQINDTLEAMAKAIFKEWFNDFGPVKAKAEGKKPFGMDDETAALFSDSFEDSELGMIPKGWEVKTLGETCDLLMGQSPPGDTYNENGNGMVFYQGRAEFGSRYPSPRLFCSEPSRIVNAGTVLLSVRAPVGDLNISTEEQTCIGRGLAGILHKAGGTTFTYYLLQSLKDKFDMYNGEGTVFGSISKDTLFGLKTISPPELVLKKFLELVRPLDNLYFSNFIESRSLTQTRDLLLPKLISGEVTWEGN